MTNNCVIVAGGNKARFFALQDVETPELESGPNLRELTGMVNSDRQLPDQVQWSDNKSGRNRTRQGATHGYDDHRSQHADEYERRFARDVATEAARVAREENAARVVLVAQKRMLGFLRDHLDPLVKTGVQVQELAKDLHKLSPRDLHEHLANAALLPRRQAPLAGT